MLYALALCSLRYALCAMLFELCSVRYALCELGAQHPVRISKRPG
jgi:hypothetical protein